MQAGVRRSHRNADAVTVFLIEIEAGILEREIGRGQGELREAIHALGVLAAEPFFGAEILDLRGKFPVADGVLENRGAVDAGHACADVLPERFKPDTDRADDSHSRNDDAALIDVHHFHASGGEQKTSTGEQPNISRSSSDEFPTTTRIIAQGFAK